MEWSVAHVRKTYVRLTILEIQLSCFRNVGGEAASDSSSLDGQYDKLFKSCKLRWKKTKDCCFFFIYLFPFLTIKHILILIYYFIV